MVERLAHRYISGDSSDRGGEGGSWNLEIWGKPGMYGAIADVTHSLRLSRRKAMRHDANERKARRAVV